MSNRQWKNEIKKRDGYVCRRCGFDKYLHVHHILPKDKYPYEQDYPPNGLTLCGNCHSLLKDKEEQTDLRGFLPDDSKIDKQLKYLSENASLVHKSRRMLLAGDKSQRINRSGENKFRQANEFSDQEEYEKAIALYDDAIRLKSDFVEAYYHRGKAKYELKRYKAAIYDYDNALCLKPDNISVYFDRGLAKYKLEQYKSVIADYNMVIQFTPDNVSAYFNRGLAKYKLGHHDTAITDFDKVNRLNPDFEKDSPYLKLAIHEKAISQNPDDAFAYYYRGQAKAELGQHDAARTDYNTAVRLGPKICYDCLLREIFKRHSWQL